VSLFPRTEFRDRRISFEIQASSPLNGGLPHGLVQLLDIVHEMDVIGSAQNDHLFGARRPLEYFVHTGQRKRNIVFRDQVQCRNLTTQLKVSCALRIPGFGWGSSTGRERYDGANTLQDVRCRECRPASEAVSHDSNLSEIQPGFRVPHSAIEYAIEEKANIRHTARNRCFDSHSFLLPGFTFRAFSSFATTSE